MNFADLFPESDYRFHMRFQRGRPEDFFKPSANDSSLILQRRQWLRDALKTYVAGLPECDPLLDETISLLRGWGLLSRAGQDRIVENKSALNQCVTLGEILEPDFLLLKADAVPQFKLLGGCVCFPSSWSLAEKIGLPLEE